MSTSRIQDKAVYIEDLSSKYAKTKCSIKEKKWSRVLQLYTLQKKTPHSPTPPKKYQNPTRNKQTKKRPTKHREMRKELWPHASAEIATQRPLKTQI